MTTPEVAAPGSPDDTSDATDLSCGQAFAAARSSGARHGFGHRHRVGWLSEAHHAVAHPENRVPEGLEPDDMTGQIDTDTDIDTGDAQIPVQGALHR